MADSQLSQSDARDKATRFVELLTSHQRDLYAYINTLLAGDSAAADVLQDTSLDLWARLADFDFQRPFLPWAYGFAYQRVLAFRKSRSRSRLVFNDAFVQLLSETYLRDVLTADKRLSALSLCLEKLDPRQGQLIRERYIEKLSVKTLATRLGGTANQISARLYRLRKILARCIEATVVMEAQ